MNKSANIFILFTLLTFAGTACSKEGIRQVENRGYAQGTTYQIKYIAEENYAQEIEDLFLAIDHSMSTYINSSIISKVNEGAAWVKVDSLFMRVLLRSLEIAEETGGAFDPTIGPLVHLWGFGYDEVRQDVTPQMIDDAKNKTGFAQVQIKEDSVRLPQGFSLDFNAIAQGFTTDIIAGFLESKGIYNYMVEVGGEIKARGTNQEGNIWKIGVDKPHTELDLAHRFQFIVELKDAALATSGNYRKFWVDETTGAKYSHTIDPASGRPAQNLLLSTTIIAPTAMDADAYATACMVMGLDKCQEFVTHKEGLEAYLVFNNPDGEEEWEVYQTEGFRNYLVELEE